MAGRFFASFVAIVTMFPAHGGAPSSPARTIGWLSADPTHPSTVFVGGGVADSALTSVNADSGCGSCTYSWASMSNDSGRDWVELTRALQSRLLGHGYTAADLTFGSIVVAPDQQGWFVEYSMNGPSPSSYVEGILHSVDQAEGCCWHGCRSARR